MTSTKYTHYRIHLADLSLIGTLIVDHFGMLGDLMTLDSGDLRLYDDQLFLGVF